MAESVTVHNPKVAGTGHHARMVGEPSKVAGTLRVPSAEAGEDAADGTRSVPATLSVPEHMPLARYWPDRDAATTVFRYALVGRKCQGKRVLEIGAAAGEGTALLADAAEVVAVDRQDLWAGSPAASLPNVRFVQCDALDLPPEWEGRFDVVVALELIEHLADPAAFQRAVFRVLAPGGILVFSTPNFDLYSRTCDGGREPLYRHHVREYRAAELDGIPLDVWSSREVSGLSQLSFPGDGFGEGFAFAHETALYDLVLGEKYPTYTLRRTGSLDAPMSMDAFQSFVVTLGKGPLAVLRAAPSTAEKSPPTASGGCEPSVVNRADGDLSCATASQKQCLERGKDTASAKQWHTAEVTSIMNHCTGAAPPPPDAVGGLFGARRTGGEEPVLPPAFSAAEAALRSCQVILRRKNQHIKTLESHADSLAGIVEDRESHIRGLRQHTANLEQIIAQRDALLAETQNALQATAALAAVPRWARSGAANWIRRILRFRRVSPTAGADSGNSSQRS